MKTFLLWLNNRDVLQLLQIQTECSVGRNQERVMDNDRAEVIVGDDTKVEIIRSTGVQGLIKTEEPKK